MVRWGVRGRGVYRRGVRHTGLNATLHVRFIFPPCSVTPFFATSVSTSLFREEPLSAIDTLVASTK